MVKKWAIINKKNDEEILDLGWFPNENTEKDVRIWLQGACQRRLSADEKVKIIEK